MHTIRTRKVRDALLAAAAAALAIAAVAGCGSEAKQAATTPVVSAPLSTAVAPSDTTITTTSSLVATTVAPPPGTPVAFVRRVAAIDDLTPPPTVVTWTPRADWCLWLGSGTYEATGDITGMIAASGAFAGGSPKQIAPCTSYGSATWIFDGTVTDCGTGTFVVLEILDIASGTGRWQIGTDSGTGDLVGVTGVGTSTITDTVSVGYEGTIECV